ncbi:MAG: S-layer homology domain-containing protein, partial [Fervidobacterium sp.]|nr:S-layer homology domain-containing protein [Fervidobacterium sp.]
MSYVFYRLLKYRGIILLFLISISIYVFSATIKDLSPSAAEYKAVNFLVEQRIMDVDANGNFKPSLLITKLDLARYLYA